MKEEIVRILKNGILEIRVLSGIKENQDIKRINELSNILHNLPLASENEDTLKTFDFELLKDSVEKYKSKYPGSILRY